MVFALYSKVVQNLAAVVEFVRSIIKTLNCCAEDRLRKNDGYISLTYRVLLQLLLHPFFKKWVTAPPYVHKFFHTWAPRALAFVLKF